jgi:acyl-CoA thioesterase
MAYEQTSPAGNAFGDYLGMRWDDESTVRLTIRPDLVNEAGLLLGPVGFALVDYAMGSTLWNQTTPDENIATINIAINYIQSATEGDVICHARVDRRNRRIAVLSAETHHEDGRLLATAIGSFSIFPPRR